METEVRESSQARRSAHVTTRTTQKQATTPERVSFDPSCLDRLECWRRSIEWTTAPRKKRFSKMLTRATSGLKTGIPPKYGPLTGPTAPCDADDFPARAVFESAGRGIKLEVGVLGISRGTEVGRGDVSSGGESASSTVSTSAGGSLGTVVEATAMLEDDTVGRTVMKSGFNCLWSSSLAFTKPATAVAINMIRLKVVTPTMVTVHSCLPWQTREKKEAPGRGRTKKTERKKKEEKTRGSYENIRKF